MKPDRIILKAKGFREGWRRHYGVLPSLHCTVLALAVAISETQAGDAWKGADGLLDTADDERNWGATTLRALNVHERIILAATARQLIANAGLPDRGDRIEFLASPQRYVWIADSGHRLDLNAFETKAVQPITPTVAKGHELRAQAIEAALRASPLDMPPAHIHCDSSPQMGPYAVWFAAFENDEDAAEYFVKLLCKAKGGVDKRTVPILNRDSGTEQELAAAMYSHGYFTGFHDPKLPDGKQRNIDEYARRLRSIAPTVRAALAPVWDSLPTEWLSSEAIAMSAHDTEPDMAAVHTGDTDRPPPGSAA